MKKIVFRLFIFVSIFSFSFINYAQSNASSDQLLWSSLGIDYSINKKIKLKLEQHYRLKNNRTTWDEYFTEFTVDYEFLKNLELSFGYRYITENDDQGRIQGDEYHARYQLDLSYKYDISRFNIAHRIRYQNKNELGRSKAQGDIPNETFRFKTSAEYNIKKWKLDPEISAEIFSRRQENGLLFSDLKLNKYRLTLGTSYSLKKYGKFGIFYRLENDIKANFDNRVEILGVKYRYSIN